MAVSPEPPGSPGAGVPPTSRDDMPPGPGAPLWRLVLLSALAMLAFAGNSLLCRVALRHGAIDPTTFTLVRLLAGAAMLASLVLAGSVRNASGTRAALSGLRHAGSWPGAVSLFAYAACFSYAYVRLDAAAGALLLFGAVQATMVAWGLRNAETPSPLQVAGYVAACGGLLAMLLPGVTAPSASGAALMIVAGIAWGAYSLLGKRAARPVLANAGNFLRATLLGAGLGALAIPWLHADAAGLGYAILSGALTSALGYAIWYAALPMLRATTAALLQLSVPVIAALGGAIWLDEAIGPRQVLASALVLGGVAVGILARRPVA